MGAQNNNHRSGWHARCALCPDAQAVGSNNASPFLPLSCGCFTFQQRMTRWPEVTARPRSGSLMATEPTRSNSSGHSCIHCITPVVSDHTPTAPASSSNSTLQPKIKQRHWSPEHHKSTSPPPQVNDATWTRVRMPLTALNQTQCNRRPRPHLHNCWNGGARRVCPCS